MTVATATSPSGSAATPVQPQTTVQTPGGPFIQYARKGHRPMYTVNGQAYGSLITNPLVAAAGYNRKFRLGVTVSGGTGVGFTATADAPFNAIQQYLLQDAFGTTLIQGDGYSVGYIAPPLAGGFGLLTSSDITGLPSYTAPSTAGNFVFYTALMQEFVKGYGLISMANSGLLPKLQIQLNPAATVGSGYAGSPVLALTVDSDFYWLPQGVQVEPIGLGTTVQFTLTNFNPTIGSGATARVAMPRLGGYFLGFAYILRDSTNARQEGWPTRWQIIVDGVTVNDELDTNFIDDQYIFLGQVKAYTKPSGVRLYTNKDSMSQLSLGLLDTGETFWSTNPGTLIEVNGTWGTAGTPPYTLQTLLAQVVPTQALIQGLPEA